MRSPITVLLIILTLYIITFIIEQSESLKYHWLREWFPLPALIFLIVLLYNVFTGRWF